MSPGLLVGGMKCRAGWK